MYLTGEISASQLQHVLNPKKVMETKTNGQYRHSEPVYSSSIPNYSHRLLNSNPTFISWICYKSRHNALPISFSFLVQAYLRNPSFDERIQSDTTSNLPYSRFTSPPWRLLHSQHIKYRIMQFSDISPFDLFTCPVSDLLIRFVV